MINTQQPMLCKKQNLATYAKGSKRYINVLTYACLLTIIFAIFFISPVQAGTKYMAGNPELSAYISGTNEVNPGDTVLLNIVIENKGVNQFKFIQSGIVERDDLPNTAKFLTVSLDSGDAPVIIKSDPQMVGDLKGSSTVKCVITTKVDADAASGSYNLPLTLKYTYMYEAEQYGLDTIQYYYKEKNETFSLPIKIRPELKISVISAETEHLNAGTEGFVTLVVKNNGHENGKNAIIKIVRNDKSPILPTASNTYIGDFSVNQTVTSRFKVSVSGEAEEQTYPLDVLVNYENSEGVQVTSDVETIGLHVGKKIDFNVVSAAGTLFPGQKKVIKVQYSNVGGAPAYNAQARISSVDPFTSNDDTAFLGTLESGEMKEASFEISVDKSATIKEYALDSEIRYRDSLDNSLISDPMKVRIVVEQENSVLGNPFIIIGILVFVGMIGYLIYHKRAKL